MSLGAESVTLTDGDSEVLQLASSNLRANYPDALFKAQKFRFDDPKELSVFEKEHFDVAIGSDLTYNRETWASFESVVKGLCSNGVTVLYATTPRVGGEWEALTADFRASKLAVEDIAVKLRGAGGILSSDVRIMRIREEM